MLPVCTEVDRLDDDDDVPVVGLSPNTVTLVETRPSRTTGTPFNIIIIVDGSISLTCW